MACKNNCKLCKRIIVSQAVTFAANTVIVNLPAGGYDNDEKYCIIVAQSIPTTATIGSPVVITIGTGTVQYPLTECNCRPVFACGIRTRTRYATKVRTTPTGGTFQMLGSPCCSPNSDLPSINGTAPVAPVVVAEEVSLTKGGR